MPSGFFFSWSLSKPIPLAQARSLQSLLKPGNHWSLPSVLSLNQATELGQPAGSQRKLPEPLPNEVVINLLFSLLREIENNASDRVWASGTSHIQNWPVCTMNYNNIPNLSCGLLQMINTEGRAIYRVIHRSSLRPEDQTSEVINYDGRRGVRLFLCQVKQTHNCRRIITRPTSRHMTVKL